MNKFEKLLTLYKNFGLVFTIKFINAYIYMLILKSRSQIHKVIEHYLETNFKDFIKYSQDKTNIGTPVDNYKIWVCWLQGKDNMPEVVKLCYDNLLNKIKDKEIVLITFENLKNYVEIPDYIYKKYQEGKILPAHFSDIVRCALLSKYGGMWIDSTIFVTDNIKQHLDIFESEFFTHKINGMDDNVFCSQYKWSTFLLGTKNKNNDIFLLTYKFLILYWQKYDMAIDYLMYDYMIFILYKHNMLMNKYIDSNKENNIDLSYFQNKLNIEYDKSEFAQIIKNNYFFKLTYKEYIDFNKPNTNFRKLKESANL